MVTDVDVDARVTQWATGNGDLPGAIVQMEESVNFLAWFPFKFSLDDFELTLFQI